MRRGLAAAVICAIGVAGCGGGGATRSQSEAKETRSNVQALLKVKAAELRRRRAGGSRLAPRRFHGALAERYETDREICLALGPEIARRLGLDPGSGRREIAKAYAKSYPGRFHRPALEGCLAGLRQASAGS